MIGRKIAVIISISKLSKEYDLYRQKYCGCIYSEMDRYMKKKKIKSNKQAVME